MADPTTFSSAKQFIGIGAETTQGTAVVPTVTVPVEKFDPQDSYTWLDDQALRGSMVEMFNRIQGVQKCEWSLSGPWFPDTFGHLAKNILGDVTTTGASAPYSHAISLLNTGASQPGSLTITDYQGPTASVGARAYAGCVVSELTVKGNAESSLITWDAKGMGWKSAAASVTPTSSPSTEVPFAAWRFQLGLAGPASGGTLVLTCGEFEITIKRELQVIYTGQNAQTPFYIQRGKVGVAGKLKFTAPADEAILNYMINNTQPQMQVKFTNGVTPTSDAAYRALTLNCQKAGFKNVKIDRGAVAVAYDGEFDAIANTTDAGASAGYSPTKLTLSNAVATY
jgi:hypothetical protein